MPGAEVGDNTLIGGGSVVTGSVPSDWVAVGVPARPLRTREEYWKRVEPQAFHIRSLSPPEKRRRLRKRFRSVLGDPTS